MKKCLKSQIVRRMQIKTMRYYITSNNMAIKKKRIIKEMLARMWRYLNPHTMLLGMLCGATIMENIAIEESKEYIITLLAYCVTL